jgi:hypothetical protein
MDYFSPSHAYRKPSFVSNASNSNNKATPMLNSKDWVDQKEKNTNCVEASPDFKNQKTIMPSEYLKSQRASSL